MLWTPWNDFGWSTDNFGATFSDTGIGTAVTAHASSAHTKGTAVSLLAGASVTEDVYGIAIGASGITGSGTGITMYLGDLLIDPAGGTSWATIINNLAFNSPYLILGGYWYYFPLYLKNGTSIGMQVQCSTANITLRAMVRVFGKPSRPDLVKCGTKVRTFGANTGSTTGTALTFGTAAMGSLSASLGTTADDLYWWQGGILINDGTRGVCGYSMDVLAGDGTNNVVCAENIFYGEDTTSERGGKTPFGTRLPWRNIAAGNNIYIRGAATTTPETNTSGVVYGLGG